MPIKNSSAKKRQRGFSLIEVLVSMLIIMVGLLGIVGMQMAALNSTETARYSSIATLMASDMSSRIVANTAYWGTPPATVAVSGVNGVVQLVGGPIAPATPPDCVASVCIASDMAYYDLRKWGGNVISGLPSGSAALACSSVVTPAVCTLTISWVEKNVAISNPTGAETGPLASGTTSSHSYQTLVSVL